MSDSDREHLLGYLLGALEDQEHEQVRQALERCPELREQLARLQQRLGPLACDRELHVPPVGLAQRTCCWLASHAEIALCQPETSGAMPQPVRGHSRTPSSSRFRERHESAPWYSWSLADLLVSAGIAMVAAMLFFPAITHSRHRSHVLGCQNNLHHLGLGLQAFATHNNGRFPQEDPDGIRAFAGVYGPDLIAGGYITDPRLFHCPAAPSQAWGCDQPVPRIVDIQNATSVDDRRRLQQQAGGDFAYCLGYFVNDKFTGPRDNRRPTFAILSDVPCLQSEGFKTANHARRGQNVLFEDGHVQFLVGCTLTHLNDHLFLNAEGQMRAGLHDQDCVLAPGWVKP